MNDLIEELKNEAVRLVIERQPNGLSTSDVTNSVIWKAAVQMEKLRDALVDFMEATAPASRQAFRDPQYGDIVQRLGDQIGYGALMSSASASWRDVLEKSGGPTGGEFVVGPCMATLISVRERAAAALEVEP